MSTAFRFYEPELFDHQLDHDWICSICSLVVRKPLDLACGHLFCFECLHHWRGDNKNNTCPICRHTLPAPMDCKINQFVTKKVWRMTVHCCNFKSGCNATVTLGEEGCNLAAHIAICPYERIPCQDCKMRLFRSALPDHATKCELRIVQCQSCDGSFKQHDLVAHQKHPLGCSFLMQCPNGCKTTDNKGNSSTTIIKISERGAHIAECPLEAVCCELCAQFVERRALASHMTELTPSHFAGLHNENKTLRALFHKLQTQIAWLKADVAILNTRVGRKMRIRDSVGKWCLAYVIAISGSKARVHFLNFDSKWDEDIDFSTEPYRFTRSGELCKVHNPYRIGQQVTASWRLNGATGQHPLSGGITCIDDCQIQVDNRMWYHVLEVQPLAENKSHPNTSISPVIPSPPSLYNIIETNNSSSLSSSPSNSDLSSSSISSSSSSTIPSPPTIPPFASPPQHPNLFVTSVEQPPPHSLSAPPSSSSTSSIISSSSPSPSSSSSSSSSSSVLVLPSSPTSNPSLSLPFTRSNSSSQSSGPRSPSSSLSLSSSSSSALPSPIETLLSFSTSSTITPTTFPSLLSNSSSASSSPPHYNNHNTNIDIGNGSSNNNISLLTVSPPPHTYLHGGGSTFTFPPVAPSPIYMLHESKEERKHDSIGGMELLPIDRERAKRMRDTDMIHLHEDRPPSSRRRRRRDSLQQDLGQ